MSRRGHKQLIEAPLNQKYKRLINWVFGFANLDFSYSNVCYVGSEAVIQVECVQLLNKPTRLSLPGWSPHKQWLSNSTGN